MKVETATFSLLFFLDCNVCLAGKSDLLQRDCGPSKLYGSTERWNPREDLEKFVDRRFVRKLKKEG